MFKRFVPLSKRPRRFVDCETTGFEPGEDGAEIIEIAIADINGKPLLEKKILPRHIETASEEALKINGYDPEVWAREAVTFESIAEEVAELLREIVWVGQNPSFDRKFIIYELKRCGVNLKGVSYHIFGTESLTEEHLLPICGSVSLYWSCAALGISNKGAHTAMADVERCRQVYLRLRRATMFHRLWWRIASVWRLKEKREYLRLQDFQKVTKAIDKNHDENGPQAENNRLRNVMEEITREMSKKECIVANEWLEGHYKSRRHKEGGSVNPALLVAAVAAAAVATKKAKDKDAV